MKIRLFVAAIPLFAAVVLAQDPPAQPPNTPQRSQDSKPAKPADARASDAQNNAGTAQTPGGNPAEVKTQNYSGTLVDATCAAGSASTTAPASQEATQAKGADRSKSADRTAAADQSQSCGVSANTSQFALKMSDGKTMKFDDVGNERAKEAFKNTKKWSDASSAGKPIRVKTTGFLTGDQLTVLSIH